MYIRIIIRPKCLGRRWRSLQRGHRGVLRWLWCTVALHLWRSESILKVGWEVRALRCLEHVAKRRGSRCCGWTGEVPVHRSTNWCKHGTEYSWLEPDREAVVVGYTYCTTDQTPSRPIALCYGSQQAHGRLSRECLVVYERAPQHILDREQIYNGLGTGEMMPLGVSCSSTAGQMRKQCRAGRMQTTVTAWLLPSTHK